MNTTPKIYRQLSLALLALLSFTTSALGGIQDMNQDSLKATISAAANPPASKDKSESAVVSNENACSP